MGKAPGEKTKEIQGGATGKTDAGAAAHQPPAGGFKTPAMTGGKSKAPAQMPGGCTSWGCKAQAKRFNFCDEHYDHFKFGLIKKTGEPVQDFEKKFEHYVAHKKGKGAQKVA